MAGGPTYLPGVKPPGLTPGPGPGQPQILPGNPGGRPSKQTPAIDTTASIMNSAAAKHNVPPWILWGVFGAESSYGKSSNWFGLGTSGGVPRSTNGPNGSPTFAGDADIAAATLARLLHGSNGNLEKALAAYSGNGYAKVGAGHGYKSGTAYIAGLASKAPLKINVPTNWFQDIAAGPTGDTIAGTLKALATPAEIMAYVVTHLADPHFWLRVLEVVGGFVALVLAFHELAGTPTPTTVARSVSPTRRIHLAPRSS